jgi:prolipoprotein diacylglyceryltransferase
MFDTAGKIAVAELAFFIIAIFPALYCLFKHGKHGLLGWVFLCVFCTIRIVGAAIIVSDESTNKTVSEAGLIIASVAIAPLIISIGGIAHESYGATFPEHLSFHKLTANSDTPL